MPVKQSDHICLGLKHCHTSSELFPFFISILAIQSIMCSFISFSHYDVSISITMSKFPIISKFLEIFSSETTSWVSVIFKDPFSIEALNNSSKQRWFYETTFSKLLLSVIFNQIASSSRKILFAITILSNTETMPKQISCFLSNLVHTFVNAVTLQTNFGSVSEEITIFSVSLHYVLRNISNQFLKASFNERENLSLVSM